MATSYRLFGSELSPYSVKVRSYLRYKGIDHAWIVRSAANATEFQKYAKLPLIPLLVGPDDVGLQDSTPIIETLESRVPFPALQPSDPILAFLSTLIEEYADEWLNKPMFHYRWSYAADQRATADRIAGNMLGSVPAEELQKASEAIRKRMVGRLGLVGSNPATAPIIEETLRGALAIFESHLERRPYLLGARPALADFGAWGQIYEMSIDPTAGALIRGEYPRISAWVERMLAPRSEGEFESWSELGPGLMRLLREQIAGIFLPWSTANQQALGRNETSFSVELCGRSFTQDCQKYHARSLGVLRAKFAAANDNRELCRILEDAGCLRWLAA